MIDLIAASLAFPTVVFTILLGLVAVYWVFVIVGALELEVLDWLHGATHSADAASGGSVDAIDGHVHHWFDGDFATVLDALGLRGVPLTIWLSVFVLFSWALTLLGMNLAGGPLATVVGGFGAGALVTLAAVGVSAAATGVVVRPLRKITAVRGAIGHSTLVGKTCTITTMRVDGEFGQAEVADGGAGLLVQVRCAEANELTRGSQALIFDYDSDAGVFHVARFDDAVDARAVERRLRTPQ
jgi:hypothetical protein